jgi:hypothetical protein
LESFLFSIQLARSENYPYKNRAKAKAGELVEASLAKEESLPIGVAFDVGSGQFSSLVCRASK